jgi:hypothetical protein
MSINDYCDDLESAARYALAKANAIDVCPRHTDVTIRLGNEDAERHAYALATNILKSDGTMWMREDLMPAIKHELDMAADGECPACASLRDIRPCALAAKGFSFQQRFRKSLRLRPCRLAYGLATGVVSFRVPLCFCSVLFPVPFCATRSPKG